MSENTELAKRLDKIANLADNAEVRRSIRELRDELDPPQEFKPGEVVMRRFIDEHGADNWYPHLVSGEDPISLFEYRHPTPEEYTPYLRMIPVDPTDLITYEGPAWVWYADGSEEGVEEFQTALEQPVDVIGYRPLNVEGVT